MKPRQLLLTLPALLLISLIAYGLSLGGGAPNNPPPAGTVGPPAGRPLPLTEVFEDCALAGWSIISADDDAANTWRCSEEFGNMEVNAFRNAAPADEWLITPPLDLDAQQDDALTFRTQTGFTDAGLPYPQLSVRYSLDYDGGDPNAAAWSDLTGITFSPEDSGVWTESGVIDLSAMAGGSVRFAFRYRSSGITAGSAARWRLDDVRFFEDVPVDLGACGDPATPISTIQGRGAVSPEAGNAHIIEGVVVGDFQAVAGNSGLRGFFVQEEDADADGDPTTSEGIFVFDGGAPTADVSEGDGVRVYGRVAEYDDRTVGDGTLTRLIEPVVLRCDDDPAMPTPAIVTLPETIDGELEQVEGMRVRVDGELSVAQTYFVGRYGQMTLAAGGRLFQPTHRERPGSVEATTLADLNARSVLILDDGLAAARCGDNPDPVPFLGAPPPAVIRAGDTVTGLIGVIDYGQIDSGETGSCVEAATRFAGDYRLHPTEAPQFNQLNPRTQAPDAIDGDVIVAGINVLNYFNGAPKGSFPTARGADTASELARQTDKLVAAFSALDADIVGVMEVENDYGDGAESAMADLTAALNTALGEETYAYIDPGRNMGGDEIAVGLLYKPAVVNPAGVPAILDDAGFMDPNGTGEAKHRPVLAQTFKVIAAENPSLGERFTIAVNHLKSKGSDCGGPPDDDLEQGNCNGTRTEGAKVLAAWLTTDPTASGDPDILILGDLNAYAKEDPIAALEAAGYVDLIAQQVGETAYSFIFDGQSGYLDHALANAALLPQAAGVTEWHINADEPPVINYDQDFNPPGYYAPDAYRASDHDPVLVGLSLVGPVAQAHEFLPTVQR